MEYIIKREYTDADQNDDGIERSSWLVQKDPKFWGQII